MGNQFSEDDILAALGSPTKVDVNKISTKPDEAKKSCKYCMSEIHPNASICPHCRKEQSVSLKRKIDRSDPTKRLWNPGVAAVLAFFVPGLGHMYRGHIFNGFAWLFVTIFLYVTTFFLGLLMHVACICMSYSGDPWEKG